jgi:hypothetical protein
MPLLYRDLLSDPRFPSMRPAGHREE